MTRALPGVRMTDCRECCEPIVFAMLDTGKRIPLNPQPDQRGNVACKIVGGNLHGFVVTKDRLPGPFHPVRMVPHFSTCEARKPSPKPAAPADPALF